MADGKGRSQIAGGYALLAGRIRAAGQDQEGLLFVARCTAHWLPWSNEGIIRLLAGWFILSPRSLLLHMAECCTSVLLCALSIGHCMFVIGLVRHADGI